MNTNSICNNISHFSLSLFGTYTVRGFVKIILCCVHMHRSRLLDINLVQQQG